MAVKGLFGTHVRVTRLGLTAAFLSLLLLPLGIGSAQATTTPTCPTGTQPSTTSASWVCAPQMDTKVSDGSIAAGGSVTDTLTLSGWSGNDSSPGGTVTFWLCGPGQTAAGCGGGGTQVGDPVPTQDRDGGTTATSPPASPAAPGIYCFRADYQPGPNEPFAAASHTNDTSECFSVTGRPKIGIEIVKGGPEFAHVGDTITYTFDVRTTTSRPLHDVTVSDPRCDTAPKLVSGDDGDGLLEPGEDWSYTCTHLVTKHDPDPLPNTATVTGTSGCGCTTTDTSSHTVDLIHPKIDIVKTVDPKSGHPGDQVTYTYRVTNTGDTTLYHVVVVDDVLGHIGTIKELAPGETVELTETYTLPSHGESVKNVATASGSDALGLTVDGDAAAIVAIVAATGSTSPSPSGGTAFTGSNATPLAALAGGLGLLGLLGLAVGRRRSTEA